MRKRSPSPIALARSLVVGLRVSSFHGDIHFPLVHREDSEITKEEKKGTTRGSLFLPAPAHFRSCAVPTAPEETTNRRRVEFPPSFFSVLLLSVGSIGTDGTRSSFRNLRVLCAIAVETPQKIQWWPNYEINYNTRRMKILVRVRENRCKWIARTRFIINFVTDLFE